MLIICEDSKSCKWYLEDAALHYRSHAQVLVNHCGKTNPIGIVENAISKKSKFEEIYCVLDRDTHDRWDEALKLAKINGIEVIASYPCYEYWLLLHFRFTRKGYVAEGDKSPAEVVTRDLRAEKGMQNYAKGNSAKLFPSLLNDLKTARARATQGLAQATGDEGGLNPSTRLHELIAKLEELGTVTKV